MKKTIASLIIVLMTAACAQTDSMTCNQCSCCHKVMGSSEGMQCPMMQGKAGGQCSCCKNMM